MLSFPLFKASEVISIFDKVEKTDCFEAKNVI